MDAAAVAQSEVAVVGFALDGRVDLRALDRDPEVAPREMSRHRFVLEHGALSIYLYALGAAVVVGTDRVDDDVRARIEHVTGQRLLVETIDAYRLKLDLQAPRPQARWDGITVPRIDDEVIEVCALVLARSAGLERYEKLADPLLDQALALAMEFGGRGRPPWGTRGMMRRIGALAVQRLELARWFVHLDRPETAWADPVVDHLYDVLREHLELAERHEALVQRIASLEHSLTTIVDAWDTRRSRALEWAIVWLIVFEIVLALLHR